MDNKTDDERIREAVASGLRDKSVILYLFTQPAFTAIIVLVIMLLALGFAYMVDLGHVDELFDFLGEFAP